MEKTHRSTGKKFSEEHKKKISEARLERKKRLGYLNSSEARKKMSETHKVTSLGNTNGFKKGMTPWNKGKEGLLKHTEETKKRIGEAFRGENHPNWKGGITPLVLRIRHSFEYRQWRSDVFTRDDYTCVLCNGRGGYIEADHYPKSFSDIFHENNIKTIEQALNCEEFWNINNGRTLCFRCHYPKHNRKE